MRVITGVIIAIMGCAATSSGQSLAGVAKKTEEERAASGRTSPAKIYTNENLPSVLVDSSAGIQPLTDETFEAAKKAAARSDAGLLNSPVLIRLHTADLPSGRVPTREELSASQMIQSQVPEHPPFGFYIVTPYSTVVDIAKDAARKFTAPQFPSVEQINARLVNIVISPGDSITTVDAIEKVVIRRGGKVFNPLKATVTPTVVQNALGLKKESAEGVFQFDYAVFAPDAAITIVMIGRSGNFEWTMKPDELSHLR